MVAVAHAETSPSQSSNAVFAAAHALVILADLIGWHDTRNATRASSPPLVSRRRASCDATLEQRFNRLSRLDAKLDALLKHAGIQFDPYRDVAPAVKDALRRGKKIEAIKHYRAATGADLREAKEFVEELQRRGGVST
jgi:hypothetical protein